MTTKVFHLRQVDRDQAPVSLGLFTTIEGAWRHARGECFRDDFKTFIECDAEADIYDNWFVACLHGSLDECGTTPDQCDVGDVQDFASLMDETATIIATVWVEQVVVHD